MYTIKADREQGMIRIEIEGFWQPETVDAYQRDLLAAIETLSARASGFVTLCDISRSPIQSQEVVAKLQAFISRSGSRPRKLAYVTNSPLSRMQGKRLADNRPDRAMFTTAAEAEAWLTAKNPPA